MTAATCTPIAKIASHQRVEFDGKTYHVTWYEDGQARVSQVVKRGLRTLNGYGRAYRPGLIAAVLATARALQCEAA